MYVNTITSEYPYSIEKLKKDHPGTSFPSKAPDATYESFGVFKVHQAQQPLYNEATQYVMETFPVLLNGLWTQVWVIHDYTPQEILERTEHLRTSLKESVTSLRWEKETGGITLPGDTHIGTNIDDQNRITSVVGGTVASLSLGLRFNAVTRRQVSRV